MSKDELYKKLISIIYSLIYSSVNKVAFNGSIGKKNILLFLPNYSELFKRRWENSTRTSASMSDWVFNFFESLPIKVLVDNDATELTKVTTDVDMDSMEMSKEDSAIKGSDRPHWFVANYLFVLEFDDSLHALDEIQDMLLQLHRVADFSNKKDSPVNITVPQYEIIEESDLELLENIHPKLDHEYKMFGRDNPLTPRDEVGPYMLFGERTLIYRYFYQRSSQSGIPSFRNGIYPEDKHVLQDLGQEYLNMGFTNKTYKAIADDFKDKDRAPSIFGSLYGLPNDTKVGIETTKEFKGLVEKDGRNIDYFIEANKVPVFSLGLSKSNVLSMKFDLDRIYTSIFAGNYGFDKTGLLILGVLGDVSNNREDNFYELLDLFRGGKVDSVRAKIKANLDKDDTFFWDSAAISGRIDQANAAIAAKIITEDVITNTVISFDDGIRGTPREQADTEGIKGSVQRKKIDFILDLITKIAKFINSKFPESLVPVGSSPIPIDKMLLGLADRLQQLAFIGKIKTLPVFSLSSNNRTLLHPCFLFGMEPVAETGSVGINLNKNRAWFNGIYKIVGFRHYISESEVYSEFAVTKSGANI